MPGGGAMAKKGGSISPTQGVAPLVYSTGKGRTCPNCRRPAARCTCRASPRAERGDGVVRVRRETKGRGGRTVTVIDGIPLPNAGLRELATKLKQICGSGGSVKQGTIEIQGDHRDKVLAALKTRDYNVKLTGG